jgi:prepilin peptidase CpaA
LTDVQHRSASYSGLQRPYGKQPPNIMNALEVLPDLLQKLLWHPHTGVLIALLLVAAWTDWRTYRIPNWIIVPGMLWGLACNSLFSNQVATGFTFGLLGLLTGLAMLLPLYMLRILGAGDVKLMAMVGAFLGAPATFKAALVVCIVGGLMALASTAMRRSLPELKENTLMLVTSMLTPGIALWRPSTTTPSVGTLPYGISISLGTLVYLILRQLGHF